MIGATRVHLEELWQQDATAIYVLRGKPANAVLRLETIATEAPGMMPAVRYHWDDVDPFGPAGQAPPTLILDNDVLDAIVNARAQVRPADTGATEALNDTRAVRDRLLNLVERIVAADIAREAPIPPADIGTGPR